MEEPLQIKALTLTLTPTLMLTVALAPTGAFTCTVTPMVVPSWMVPLKWSPPPDVLLILGTEAVGSTPIGIRVRVRVRDRVLGLGLGLALVRASGVALGLGR